MVAVAQTPNLSPLSLDPYGQLIKTLYPRAQSMAVYGVGGVRRRSKCVMARVAAAVARV